MANIDTRTVYVTELSEEEMWMIVGALQMVTQGEVNSFLSRSAMPIYGDDEFKDKLFDTFMRKLC